MDSHTRNWWGLPEQYVPPTAGGGESHALKDNKFVFLLAWRKSRIDELNSMDEDDDTVVGEDWREHR